MATECAVRRLQAKPKAEAGGGGAGTGGGAGGRRQEGRRQEGRRREGRQEEGRSPPRLRRRRRKRMTTSLRCARQPPPPPNRAGPPKRTRTRIKIRTRTRTAMARPVRRRGRRQDREAVCASGQQQGAAEGSAEAAPWRHGAKSSTAMEMGGETVDAKSGIRCRSRRRMYDAYAIAARILDAIQRAPSCVPSCMRSCPRGTSCPKRGRAGGGRARAKLPADHRHGHAAPRRRRQPAAGGASSRRATWSRRWRAQQGATLWLS